MKLKRITAALLAGVMCVGLLAGCGSKTAETTAPTETTAVTETAAATEAATTEAASETAADAEVNE